MLCSSLAMKSAPDIVISFSTMLCSSLHNGRRIVDPLCCCQCPAALVSLLCSMATLQTKNTNKIAAEINVASVCSVACVIVWLCSIDPCILNATYKAAGKGLQREMNELRKLLCTHRHAQETIIFQINITSETLISMLCLPCVPWMCDTMLRAS